MLNKQTKFIFVNYVYSKVSLVQGKVTYVHEVQRVWAFNRKRIKDPNLRKL